MRRAVGKIDGRGPKALLSVMSWKEGETTREARRRNLLRPTEILGYGADFGLVDPERRVMLLPLLLLLLMMWLLRWLLPLPQPSSWHFLLP